MMPLLPHKSVLAVAAVVDLALNARNRRVTAKVLAARHHLSPRHLDPVQQALRREGILKSATGQHGGYTLAREPGQITADDILHAVPIADDGTEAASESPLLSKVVHPALAHALSNRSAASASRPWRARRQRHSTGQESDLGRRKRRFGRGCEHKRFHGHAYPKTSAQTSSSRDGTFG
jgi:Rrf2 family protein